MKKMILMILCLLLLAGCTGNTLPDTTEGTEHTHTPGTQWDRDAVSHWHLCECGEKLDTAEHTLTEDVCTVCGSEVWVMDGSADVCNYNEYGEMVRWSSYDGAGTVMADWVYEFEYDENGNMLSCDTFEQGVLMEESEYTTESGMSVLTKSTSYYDDGSWFVNEYDEIGNVTTLLSYDAEGNLVLEGHYEFKTDAEGASYNSKSTEHYDDGTRSVAEYNEYGDNISRILYDADGNVEVEEIYEWEYDEEGNWLFGKTYENGVLTKEITFATGQDDYGWWTYPETVVEYFEDGSRTVSKYDVNDELISEITYDAAGNIVE